MRQQVLYGCGLRLYAVQREKRLVLARVESDAVRVAAADELTVVLRSTMRPRGEAARREGEGQPTIGEHLDLEPGRPRRCERRHQIERQLDGRRPAPCAAARQ